MTDTNTMLATIQENLSHWQNVRQRKITAQHADDANAEDDLGAVMDRYADDVIRATAELIEALQQGAALPDAWKPRDTRIIPVEIWRGQATGHELCWYCARAFNPEQALVRIRYGDADGHDEDIHVHCWDLLRTEEK